MLVKRNGAFEFSENDYLWKYMDIYKFFSFLLNKQLYFTRLDNFEDPLEGLTENLVHLITEYDLIPELANLNTSLTYTEKLSVYCNKNILKERIQSEIELQQKSQFASCWHIAKKESIAMWKLYSDKNSIAIRFKPSELIDKMIKKAEKDTNDDFAMFIYGCVDYVDMWPCDLFEEKRTNIEHVAFKKDLSYKHENEFRFVIVVKPECYQKYENFNCNIRDIDIGSFQIFASPFMDSWKYEVLEKMLINHSIENRLTKSKLMVDGFK